MSSPSSGTLILDMVLRVEGDQQEAFLQHGMTIGRVASNTICVDSPYSILIVSISDISPEMIPSKGIYNVTYDGITWKLNSDWDYDVGIFELNKVDYGRFEGISYGRSARQRQSNVWIMEK